MIELGNTAFKVGGFIRTVYVKVWPWGIEIEATDDTYQSHSKSPNKGRKKRNFLKCKTYPTIENNIRRGMKYYGAQDSETQYMVNLYNSTKAA